MEPGEPDFDRVAEIYGLGEVESAERIERGEINTVYDIKTDKDRFIVKTLPEDREDLQLGNDRCEFQVLDRLRSKDFGYQVPRPLENSEGKYISTLDGRPLWVYPRLEGEIVESLDIGQIREMGEAIARYHTSVEGLELDKRGDFFDFGWLYKRYEDMKVDKPKNKVDRFMMENVGYMEDMLDRIDGLDFRENIVAAHSDFHAGNLLFDNEGLVGILDFDNVRMRPRIRDLGYAAWHLYLETDRDMEDGRLQALIDSYESVSPLTDEEEEMLFPSMAAGLCTVFWWDYAEMDADNDKRLHLLQETVNIMKAVEKGL